MEDKLMDDVIISIFCKVDDFCKEFSQYMKQYCIAANDKKVITELPSALSLSEAMTICIAFHLLGYRTFKNYYVQLITEKYKKFFPNLVSYNRFVELMPYTALPTIFLIHARKGKCSGISFIDSTTLDVCDNHRINQHKVFKGIAQRGKSSTGWFYGFKLHLVINDRGEILSFCLTAGNTDDRNPDVIQHLTKDIIGKLFADKGYISQKLIEKLWNNGIQLITKQKKNAKNKVPMRLYDSIMLRKRAVIESVNDFLKNICQIEHSRHRSHHNFIVNLVAGLAAYSFLPKKPNIRFNKNLLTA